MSNASYAVVAWEFPKLPNQPHLTLAADPGGRQSSCPMSLRSPTGMSLRLAAALVPFALATVGLQLPARAQEPGPEPAGGDAVAVGTGPLETAILAEKFEVETLPDGGEQRRFVVAQRLDAGDEVHYTIRVRNPGTEPVLDVVVTKRLPFGLTYIPGSAVGPACEIELSADGGATFVPAGRKAASYSHVRWILRRPLAPGATALLRFRATFG